MSTQRSRPSLAARLWWVAAWLALVLAMLIAFRP